MMIAMSGVVLRNGEDWPVAEKVRRDRVRSGPGENHIGARELLLVGGRVHSAGQSFLCHGIIPSHSGQKGLFFWRKIDRYYNS